MTIPRILSIAGSDSGGGAGIQADIKTITALGGHAMTAITAITAQNTLGVNAVMAVPAEMVIAQIDACVGDIGVDAVKIGMLGSAEVAEAVADWLVHVGVPVVLDPVMVASSGARLADDSTIEAIRRAMTWSSLITPNLPELEALGGLEKLVADGQTVLVKGGHGDGPEIVDRLVGGDGEIARWSGSRIATRHDHGTGCTLSAAIATLLARPATTFAEAIGEARDFVRSAMLAAPGLGAGRGPMGQGFVRFDR